MPTLGQSPLTLEDVEAVAQELAPVELGKLALQRIRRGRSVLEARMAAGERIYGVTTGVGGNQKYELSPEDAVRLQRNLMNHLSCATGQPLPEAVVRAATLLRIATFATGTSAVREELVEALLGLLNAGIAPVVPRYGSVGASGDLMPSAYIGRALLGIGDAVYQGKVVPAAEALRLAGLEPVEFAPKEGLALINGTTVMTAVASLLWLEFHRVFDALLRAIALSVEALEAPFEPYEPWPHELKGHPGQIMVAEYIRELFAGSRLHVEGAVQSCYSLRCAPQGLGPVSESLDAGREIIEREINSANDNPLVHPDGTIFRAGNFYGAHISRLLDTAKIDMAICANWANALMAVLVDDRFNNGLPANLVSEPGVNSGFKGMQLSVTSLACAIRHLAGPSSIHSLPTETYNQDVVSLGMHAAVTAMDAFDCLSNQIAMVLIAAAQAAELRGDPRSLGAGNRETLDFVRRHAAYLDQDRPMEDEIATLSKAIRSAGIAEAPNA